jgi:hypothetical protein
LATGLDFRLFLDRLDRKEAADNRPVVEKPDLNGKRLAFGLAEDRVGHYREFRGFFVQEFFNSKNGL